MASSKYDILKTPPKALTFDVFGTTKFSQSANLAQGTLADIALGTVVDWRKTVTETLVYCAAAQISSSSRSADLSPGVRTQLSKLTAEDWAAFAQEWRNTYKTFVMGFVPGESEWRDIDTHHHLSLMRLLKEWKLEGLYTADEMEDLSRIWHYLDPWKDTSAGIRKLNKKFVTSTLSNGNQELLKDLNKHGALGFQKLQSSADFKAYKPHPSVYKGAAQALGLETDEVAMVAAHLSDLRAARSCGFRTIYVERKQEEDWQADSKEYQDAKTWVDMWVSEQDDGFLEVARRFGLS